jgi:hypothetical protein
MVSIELKASIFDVHESVHLDATMKITKQDALYRLIRYSKSSLHVSGDVFVHHREHLTVFTVSGSVQLSCYKLVPTATWLNITRYCKYS